MKKIATFLISAILTMNCVNIYAQNPYCEWDGSKAGKVTHATGNYNTDNNEGCPFRFVLKDPGGIGWYPDNSIDITVDGVNYGSVSLPWGTPTPYKEEILLLPSGELQCYWNGSYSPVSNCFKIYNSSNELLYESPDLGLPDRLFLIYQNECNIGIASTTLSNQISVYPNPANNELRITNYELRITAVEIFDFLGRRQCLNFAQQPKAEDTMVINISNLPNGIYFVMITTEQERVTKKVIKQ
jgi:hypothetical protein